MNDREAEDFVASSDLTEFDLSGFVPARFRLKSSDDVDDVRLPEELLTTIRACARKAGIPYQTFIRIVLERELEKEPSE